MRLVSRWIAVSLMAALLIGCSKQAPQTEAPAPAAQQPASQPATPPTAQQSSTGADDYSQQGSGQQTATQQGGAQPPVEAKPAEAKPAEAKPAEAKPAEAKPAEAKPAEEKPAEEKPAEQKPAENEIFVVVAAQSEAAYVAREKFVNRTLPNEAIGVSKLIEGQLILGADGTLLPSKVTVDLRGLKSDSSSRDSRLRSAWLESNKFPFAEFTLGGIDGAAPQWVDGQPLSFKLTGKLKVREIERDVVWDATAVRTGNDLKLTAEVQILMTDFGVDPPDIAGMLKAENELKLRVSLVARKG